MTRIRYEALYGQAAQTSVQDLARLRIQVFREYPYLYDGTEAYESRYLETYFKCPQSLIILAWDDLRVIGATTAIPLAFEEPAFQKPFLEQQLPPEQVMYFGESVLLPNYRGQGIGKIFLQKRIEYAASYPGIRWAAFCAVQRAPDDPRRPAPYHPLDKLWQSYGFLPRIGMQTLYHWREIGQTEESEQLMQFWLRPIQRAIP